LAVDTAALERIAAHLSSDRNSSPVNTEIIRVSSSGECGRKIGYRLLGFPQEQPTTPELVTFEVGHSYHHMVQSWLVAMGWTTKELLEFPLTDPEMRSRGSCDGVTVRLDKDGEPDPKGTRRLIEIKSITNVAKERYGMASAGAFDRLDKPRDYHLDQANVYAHMWNRLVRSGQCVDSFDSWEGRFPGPLVDPEDLITHITMIYVGKDTSEMPIKVFTVPISTKKMERLRAKFAGIWQHVDRGELPPRDHDPFSNFPPCTYCPFQTLCISDGSPR
jgi:hypothetical protein